MFRKLKINALITAILYVVLGVLCIVFPSVVLDFIAVILEAMLVIAGIVYIIVYLRTWEIEYRSNGLAIGILLIFCALFLFLQREIVASMLPMFMGFAIVISGALKLQNAIVLSRAKDRLWIPTLVLALVCLGLGAVVMANPFASLHALIVLIGVSLAISGLTDLVIIILMSRRTSELTSARKA